MKLCVLVVSFPGFSSDFWLHNVQKAGEEPGKKTTIEIMVEPFTCSCVLHYMTCKVGAGCPPVQYVLRIMTRG